MVWLRNWSSSTSGERPRLSFPRRRCSGRPFRFGATAPRWSAALKGLSIGSRPRSSAGSSKAAHWSSGRLTPREACRPSGSDWCKHIETVYAHINQLDESHLSSDNGLIDDGRRIRPGPPSRCSPSQRPSDPRSSRRSSGVPLDKTGVETTFTTVADIVRRWGRYKDSHNQTYRTMVIVVTDEVGDDEERLEDAIAQAQKAKVPVYVLGSQAIFGRNV